MSYHDKLNTLFEGLGNVYSYAYAVSPDSQYLIKRIAQEFRSQDREVLLWTKSKGIVDPTNIYDVKQKILDFPRAFKWFLDTTSIKNIIFLNAHHFLKSPDTIDMVFISESRFLNEGESVIFISDTLDIPSTLKGSFLVVDFGYPAREDIKVFADSVGVSLNGDVPAGITITDFGRAILYSKKTGKEIGEFVEKLKLERIRETEVLTLYHPAEQDSFEYLGGLYNLKEFIKETAHHPDAKGIFLVGIPGTGKTAIGKATGNFLSLPTVIFDFGAVFGSLVGQSEERMRRALQLIEVLTPCVLIVDEIEKGMGGIRSSHLSDGGTGSRVFSYFLRWLEERPEGIYVIATCNDVSKIPPEFVRSERWDAVFGLDFPTEEEKEIIWEIWGRYYEVETKARPNDEFWTGADIKTCCRLAHIMKTDLVSASRFVNPVYRIYKEDLDKLRDFMRKCTIPASLKALP